MLVHSHAITYLHVISAACWLTAKIKFLVIEYCTQNQANGQSSPDLVEVGVWGRDYIPVNSRGSLTSQATLSAMFSSNTWMEDLGVCLYFFGFKIFVHRPVYCEWQHMFELFSNQNNYIHRIGSPRVLGTCKWWCESPIISTSWYQRHLHIHVILSF